MYGYDDELSKQLSENDKNGYQAASKYESNTKQKHFLLWIAHIKSLREGRREPCVRSIHVFPCGARSIFSHIVIMSAKAIENQPPASSNVIITVIRTIVACSTQLHPISDSLAFMLNTNNRYYDTNGNQVRSIFH